MSDLPGRLRAAGVLPVVTVQNAAVAPDLVRTLAGAGLPLVEITLRTPVALRALEAAIAAEVAGAVLGVGTVITAAQARDAVAAGARFVVSPGLDEGVVAVAAAAGVLVLPGVATPTEAMRAAALGLPAVKLFPAEPCGGVALVDALASVLPELALVPTGGITAASAPGYLRRPTVLAVGGSWVTPTPLLDRRDWDGVAALARAAVALRPGAA